jgi:hypothetical protein
MTLARDQIAEAVRLVIGHAPEGDLCVLPRCVRAEGGWRTLYHVTLAYRDEAGRLVHDMTALDSLPAGAVN